MRFFQSLFLIFSLVTFFIFQVNGQTDQKPVKQNAIRIKLSKAPQQVTRSSFNLNTLDQLNRRTKATSLKRVFPNAGKFEKAHKEYGLDLWYEIRFQDTYKISAIDSLCQIYKDNTNVRAAEPVFIRHFDAGGPENGIFAKGLSGFPDDPQFNVQWHYQNTGQSGGTPGADINLLNAWSGQTGSSDVIVAVIDQGIDYAHEDLAQNMWVNEAEFEGSGGIDDDNNGFIDDIYGYGFGDGTGNITGQYHGTHVGGTIAAANHNSVGVAGIAGGSGSGDGVRLMSLAVFGAIFQGGFENAFIYAADNGAVVAQNSWGGGGRSLVLEDAIRYFIERAGYDNSEANFGSNIQTGPMAGGIVIFAAGNSDSSNPNVGYPASLESVIAVASTDHNDQKSDFSNYGEWVDIAAPGSNVFSTFPGNSYAYLSGTSMACPHVSGVAALIVSEFGGAGFTPGQVRGRLLSTTDDISEGNPEYTGMLGSGRLNAANALLVDDEIPPAAINDLAVFETYHNRVVLTWTATGESDREGSASSYEIRYSNSPINEANFNSATEADNNLRPSTAGSTELFEVQGLEPFTRYYFAIKSADYFGNTSGISNTISTETETMPEISVNPMEFTGHLYAGQTSRRSMSISNTGGSLLEFNITTRSDDSASLSAGWLTFDTFNGAVNRGEFAEIGVLIDAAGLMPGIHQTNIIVESNSLANEFLEIPVTLTVTDAAKIEVSPASLDFDERFIDTSSDKAFTIKNSGTDSLFVSDILAGSGVFSADTVNFAIPPDGEQNIFVTFTPPTTGVFTDSLAIYSNDPVDSILFTPLTGVGIEPPIISLSTDSVAKELFTGGLSAQQITIYNNGGSDLNFEISIAAKSDILPDTVVMDLDPVKTSLEANRKPTLNQTNPQSGPVEMAGSYSGDYLAFGISEYGEIMPFQFPVGNEHLASGSWISGYSVIYEADGNDNIKFTSYIDRNGIVPVSYRELINSETQIKVEVVTRTSEGYVEITRLFSFRKTDKFVRVHTSIRNISSGTLNNLVFKTFADWDIGGDFSNNWNIDAGRGMIYAYESNYATIASNLAPDYKDMDGWSDYSRRSTNENVMGPVSNFDGLELLHFELGSLNPSSAAVEGLTTVFAVGESLEELKSSVDRGVNSLPWLGTEPVSGTVAAGSSLAVDVLFNALKLASGTYNADIVFHSNDVENPEVSLAARLDVTSAPDIDVKPDSIRFDSLFVSHSARDSFAIYNEGFKPLTITDIASSNPDFSVSTGILTIEPGELENVFVDFAPSVAGLVSGELTIFSNDPDHGKMTVELLGQSVEPPVISVSVDSLAVALYNRQKSTQTFEIDNVEGGSPLKFQIRVGAISVLDESGPLNAGKAQLKSQEKKYIFNKPAAADLYKYKRSFAPNISSVADSETALEDVLDSLNSGYTAINSLIPNRFDFSEGETSLRINDGGSDMYDGGNYLYTNLGSFINYTNGTISTSPNVGGKYFTAKYPGLFVFAGDIDGVEEFFIGGNLGADGNGNVDGSVLSIVRGEKKYLVFVKRVYDAGDPSVNHMIIVEDNGTVSHEFSVYTNDDYHRVFNLSGSNRLYYLLFAGFSGTYIDNSIMKAIANAFLDEVDVRFVTFNPASGTVGAGQSLTIEAIFNNPDLREGRYATKATLESNDPEIQTVVIPVTLNSLGKVAPPDDIILNNTDVDENPPQRILIGKLDASQSFEGEVFYSFNIVGETNGHFEISGDSLLTNAVFNYEEQNSFPVRIRVTDSFEGSFEKDFTIFINDINESPSDITLSLDSVAENRPGDTFIGNLVGFDEDFNDSLTFSLKTDALNNALFKVTGDQLRSNSSFNYEEHAQHEVIVVATDKQGAIYEKAFVVNIMDADDLPSEIMLDGGAVEENSAAGTLVGTLVTLDQDANDSSYVYKLVSGEGSDDNNSFNIADDELYTAKELDFEEKDTLSIRVLSFNPKGQYIENILPVHLNDLDDEITALEENDKNQEILLYPNPVANGKVRLKIENQEFGTVNIIVSNIVGQWHKTLIFEKLSLSHKQEIDLSNFPDGIIIVKISFNDKVVVQKLKKVTY